LIVVKQEQQLMNKKILFSTLTIFASLALITSATLAFFSDSETSTGNIFTAGVIDLQVDNDGYYNGVVSQETSWEQNDLTLEKFFNFSDVKPRDFGENTVSIHVNNNDAYVCSDVTLTSNSENTLTQPEIDLGDDSTSGELADRINFLLWADDGDNVLEVGEDILPGGVLGDLDVNETTTVTIADSNSSIYDPSEVNEDGALNGDETYFLGEAWCFGAISPTPLPSNGYVSGPAGDNNLDTFAGTPEDGGFTCDGSSETNISQTDSLTADITLRAVQSRNNTNFVCTPPTSPSPSTSSSPSPAPSGSPDPGEPFADAVPTVNGTFGHCCDGSDLSSNPAIAATLVTGAPDSPPDSDFIQISDSSSVTLQFVNNKAVNGVGADIRVYIYDALFPATALIEVSHNCSTYVSAGLYSDTANVDIDLTTLGLTEALCVRITDQVAIGDPFPTLGFDLDAMEALNSVSVP
jgi:predicted ribosomally synthesized peptide with SipW-like signal peptide